MVWITKTVDFSIDEFTDEELIDEITSRGHTVNGEFIDTIYEVEDHQLIKEIENRGYSVIEANLNEKEMLAYIISILPEEKIGSEKFMFQSMIRELYSKGNVSSWKV